MGDPRKIRKKFEKPFHPWQAERIIEESALVKEYGLKNKTEVWKMKSLIRNYAYQAKRLYALKSEQAEREKKQLIQKLNKLGLVQKNARLEDVLGLNVKHILDRRLQTFVLKKGLAKTIRQARQFVVHRHINIAGKLVTIPSYLVRADEEPLVSFVAASSLADEAHPERTVERKEKKPKKRPFSKFSKRRGGNFARRAEPRREEAPAKQEAKPAEGGSK